MYWHPHNLGRNAEMSFAQQEKIFKYYRKLQQKYGFESRNMYELATMHMLVEGE